MFTKLQSITFLSVTEYSGKHFKKVFSYRAKAFISTGMYEDELKHVHVTRVAKCHFVDSRITEDSITESIESTDR